MKKNFKEAFLKAVFSGIIGSVILISVVYVFDREVNWPLQIAWFLLFTLVMSFFYGYYLSKSSPVKRA